MILADDVGEFLRSQDIGERPAAHPCRAQPPGRDWPSAAKLHAQDTPSRLTANCHSPLDALMAEDSVSTESIATPFTSRMTSPLRKNRRAGPPLISEATTPVESEGRPNSSATAGERLATTRPENGVLPLSSVSIAGGRLGRAHELYARFGALSFALIFDDARGADLCGRDAIGEFLGVLDRLAIDAEDDVAVMMPAAASGLSGWSAITSAPSGLANPRASRFRQ